MKLWDNTPGLCEKIPQIHYYAPSGSAGSGTVIIFPGGGYIARAEHEGAGYAKFLAASGIHAFVVDYRVAPHYYPLPQIDARRAVRFVRAHAEKYGIDKNKVAVMGSSAGGHLAASISTCAMDCPTFENIDAIDKEDSLPNAQILCYPVICPPSESSFNHGDSYQNLLGEHSDEEERAVNPIRHITANTPPAFIWHTFNDNGVDVRNSLEYATALRQAGVATEMHIFPYGYHGLGTAEGDSHVHQWVALVLNWLCMYGWNE